MITWKPTPSNKFDNGLCSVTGRRFRLRSATTLERRLGWNNRGTHILEVWKTDCWHVIASARSERHEESQALWTKLKDQAAEYSIQNQGTATTDL